jgi:hypothetical protein
MYRFADGIRRPDGRLAVRSQKTTTVSVMEPPVVPSITRPLTEWVLAAAAGCWRIGVDRTSMTNATSVAVIEAPWPYLPERNSSSSMIFAIAS